MYMCVCVYMCNVHLFFVPKAHFNDNDIERRKNTHQRSHWLCVCGTDD